MNEATWTQRPLTAEQQRLAADNIGLVRLHLKRNVRALPGPRGRREYADLFQEGCLALVEAAGRFDPEDGIPFASFAILRIHNAVSKALHRNSLAVYVPPPRSDRPVRKKQFHSRKLDRFPPPEELGDDRRDKIGSENKTSEERSAGTAVPEVLPLDATLARGLRARPPSRPEDPSVETIGQRLFRKYQRAVRVAGRAVERGSTQRADRRELIRILVAERFLIPEEELRQPLRRIAQDTNSSFARVRQCGQRLGKAIRDALVADPEFNELRRRARAHPDGPAAAIDDRIERRLAVAGADELVRRYRRAQTGADARLLHSVIKASRADVEKIIRGRYDLCEKTVRQELLEETQDLARSSARADPNERPRRRGGRESTRRHQGAKTRQR